MARAGDILQITRTASIQFDGDRAIWFRLIRMHPRPTCAGWVWLDGYELDRYGNAVVRREIFVQSAGVLVLPRGVDPVAANSPRTRQAVLALLPFLGR